MPPINLKHIPRIWPAIERPFLVASFKILEAQTKRKIVPRRWLSPAQVLSKDLELIEPKSLLDQKFIDDLAAARDRTLGVIKKQYVFSALIFIFLLSGLLTIKIDINLGGFSLKQTPGIAEGLLLVGNLLACYTIILQSNCYIMESAIRTAIQISLPAELRQVYIVRYFPHELNARYSAFNMPYLTAARPQLVVLQVSPWIIVTLVTVTALAFSGTNLYLLYHYLWLNPSFGIWSHLLLAYLLILGIACLMYLLLTRLPLPYNDYFINLEMELLKQQYPDKYRERLKEAYGALMDRRIELEQKGYLKRQG